MKIWMFSSEKLWIYCQFFKQFFDDKYMKLDVYVKVVDLIYFLGCIVEVFGWILLFVLVLVEEVFFNVVRLLLVYSVFKRI